MPPWELEYAIAQGAGWWYRRMRQIWEIRAEVEAAHARKRQRPGDDGQGAWESGI